MEEQISLQFERVMYCGIMDCHGIESFVPKYQMTDKDEAMLQWRAKMNRHRHAISYRVFLLASEANKLLDILEKDPIDALYYLKTCPSVKEFGLDVTKMPASEQSWHLIPNPLLDPWRTPTEEQRERFEGAVFPEDAEEMDDDSY